MSRPFLKWAGGKYRLIGQIQAVLPRGRRLVEPFAGSAAVFLNTQYAHNLVTDANPDLMRVYRCLQEHGAGFVDACRGLFTPDANQREVYDARRARFNAAADPMERAALFVYLNRHGYNGLCRTNAAGQFNVPFGRYARPYFPEAELYAFCAKARQAEFRHAQFDDVMRSTICGDVVYCDPPYVPLSSTANFTSYSAGGFDLDTQQALAELARELASRGIPVVISNHDTEFTRTIYAGAQIVTFDVHRHISRDGANRRAVRELLACWLPAGEA